MPYYWKGGLKILQLLLQYLFVFRLQELSRETSFQFPCPLARFFQIIRVFSRCG